MKINRVSRRSLHITDTSVYHDARDIWGGSFSKQVMYKVLELLEILLGDIASIAERGLAVFPVDSAINRCWIPGNLIDIGYGSCYGM